jgi:hypothetical protein
METFLVLKCTDSVWCIGQHPSELKVRTTGAEGAANALSRSGGVYAEMVEQPREFRESGAYPALRVHAQRR